MFIKKFLSDQKRNYLQNLRGKYFSDLRELLPDSPCVISNNCFAGFIYQDIQLPYLSPTAGLYFFFPDYIEFLSDLENNLKGEITFVDKSKYDLGNERLNKSKYKYPIGLLNKRFEIHFLHYSSIQEAETKWRRRVERVDTSKLIVIGTELDLCTDKDIMAFDALPFQNKFFFTRNKHDLASAIFVKEFQRNPKLGDPYRYGHILYKNFVEKLKVA